MNVSVHQRIRILIEETNEAFACYDTVNADFADFAALALREFKDALGNTELTQDQLKDILRMGMQKHSYKDQNSWAVSMANHIAKAANNPARIPKTGFSVWKTQVEAAETA